MTQNDSLIGRATVAIEAVMADLEQENNELLGRNPTPTAATDRELLAEIIARALDSMGMLRDPDDSSG